MSVRVYSVDGRTFAFDVPLAQSIPVGSYVTIETETDHTYLAQVLGSTIHDGRRDDDGSSTVQMLHGRGTLLSELVDGRSAGLDGAEAFGAGTLTPAGAEVVDEHLSAGLGAEAAIELGRLRRPSGVPARLRAKGFGRHTFLCGQSGSGKTYTLGVILEQLLLETDIRIGVLDPNSDYVNLGSVRPREATASPPTSTRR